MRNGLSGAKEKEEIKMGIVNVVTLTGKVEELVEFMMERELDVLGLSETKWKGTGERKLRNGYRLFWSGGKEMKNGVGMIVSSRLWEHI
ncbi:hypothetical protein HET73_00650, partial [Wolbachia endosymbiont of Atemnus politus]|uniref:hypothetical protein n=1 Tax=Wolbachia endosymbiont of Atemnus politus TaxID=2682840 RepID=UPI00157202DC